MKTKKIYLYLIIALIVGVLIGSFFSSPDAVSPTKEEQTVEAHEHNSDSIAYWTCSMHHQIHQDQPGACPICGMDLVPVKKEQTMEAETDSVAYWTCSMHHQIHQDQPGACPICGMDLVPVKTNNSTTEEASLNRRETVLSRAAAKLAEIETTPVKKGNPEGRIDLVGQIKTNQKSLAVITARFRGRIEALNINFEGQKVHKGEPLATLYSPDLMTAQKELIAAEKLRATQPDYFKAARKKLRLWGITNRQIKHILAEGEPRRTLAILSPTTGTVLTKKVSIGAYVEAGEVMFKIADLDQLWAVFEVYEADLPLLKEGDLVRFTTKSLSNRVFKGDIDFISPVVDIRQRTVKVRVVINNRAHLLKPGMLVKGFVKIKADPASGEVLYIPESAVLWTGKRAVVYVKEPGNANPTFYYREVVLGPKIGDYYIIKSGLEAGELVASHGAFQIDATAQINGEKSMMNP